MMDSFLSKDKVSIKPGQLQPFVYYEEPVCQAFREQYGEDMRKLPVNDERVQRAMASFVTLQLREIRAMLDEVGKAQGRYIPNCYLAPVQTPPPICRSRSGPHP